jgi:hypothetical protein
VVESPVFCEVITMLTGKRIAAFLLTVFLPALALGQVPKTPAAENGYTKYTQHEQVAAFLQALDNASRELTVQVVGHTGPAKDFPGADLYLCVITDEGAATPAALNRKKPTFMVTASQHGNEQSAKEAALALVRDLSVGDLKHLLKRMNFLVIPQANPYGNFVNRRQNEQNLDLNRDHVKLESPETRAIHAVFRAWMPEMTLDMHEKGDDYYRVSTGAVSNINIDPAIERFSRDKLFPAIARYVEALKFTWFEYLVTEAMGSQGAAGAPEPRQQPGGPPPEMLTRPSTTDLNDGRNSPGIYNTISFIQECASRHDLPTLKERSAWQYAGLLGLIHGLLDNGSEAMALVRNARTSLLARAKRPGPGDVVHLRMEYVREPTGATLDLKSFERPARGAAAQPATAEPGEPKVVTQTVKNWFPKVESRLSVERPGGYLIPADRQDIVDTLLAHGIQVSTVSAGSKIDVESYRITELVPSTEDYVAPTKISVEKKTQRAEVHKGDFFVSVVQPAANLIPSLLEPQSEYGLIRYRVYKLVPEVGATFPILRVRKGVRVPVVAYRKQ